MKQILFLTGWDLKSLVFDEKLVLPQTGTVIPSVNTPTFAFEQNNGTTDYSGKLTGLCSGSLPITYKVEYSTTSDFSSDVNEATGSSTHGGGRVIRSKN